MDRFILEQRLGTKIPPKIIYLVRHGQSTHNAHLFAEEGADLNDSRYIDAALTSRGEYQARDLLPELERLDPDLLVCSPLSRAIQTCLLACQRISKPLIVNPLCAERVAYACDIGRPVEVLRNDFPDLNYELVQPPEAWWWMPEELEDRTTTGSLALLKKHPVGAYKDCEPLGSLQKRATEFRQWLLQRPEQKIAVFAHGVFLTMFLGDNSIRLRNGELKEVFL